MGHGASGRGALGGGPGACVALGCQTVRARGFPLSLLSVCRLRRCQADPGRSVPRGPLLAPRAGRQNLEEGHPLQVPAGRRGCSSGGSATGSEVGSELGPGTLGFQG